MRQVEAIETDGWNTSVNDIFTNERMPYRLKVTKIEIDNEQANPNDTRVYCVAMDLKNDNKLVKTTGVPEGPSYRVAALYRKVANKWREDGEHRSKLYVLLMLFLGSLSQDSVE